MSLMRIDTSDINEIIHGRIDRHIYAFMTNTFPSYLKVGDTSRLIGTRLAEWRSRKGYEDLRHLPEWEWLAQVGSKEILHFRDYSVHQYLIHEKQRSILPEDEVPEGVYYSNEFFKDAVPEDVKEAIDDIAANANTTKYKLYKSDGQESKPEIERKDFPLRDIQSKVVENFKSAYDAQHRNLLMYAVMRFGKSHTAMCCAIAQEAHVVLIVSAKADVASEWDKTIRGHVNFKDFVFLSKDDFQTDGIIQYHLNKGKRVAVFLTLQDLQGENIKEKHHQIFDSHIDLLIVDETHFGARAEKYGYVLKETYKWKEDKVEEELKRIEELQAEEVDTNAEETYQIIKKRFNVDTTLHLSGTPYKILMGSEFKKEDVISMVTYVDIADEKQKWDDDNKQNIELKVENPLTGMPYQYWDNPYFGFPEMIRFAFNPNKSAKQLLESLKDKGQSASLFTLFEPKSTIKDPRNNFKKFKHEAEVLDFLKVIDGSKRDDEVFGFLDYDKIKKGKMCRHMVFVLPLCASCDAMEALLKNDNNHFKNLSKYEIVNIAGLESRFGSPDRVAEHIASCEKKNQKTITLTVNRMLTGSTVKEWDTMVFLKETSSPQEYDQAIFRIQNPYISTYVNAEGDSIKIDNKPQTLLVDFSPNRMFVLQEKKSKIYTYNTNLNGNENVEKRLKRELQISPIIIVDKGKMHEVKASNVMDEVRKYNANRSAMDEAQEIPIDEELLLNDHILSIIKNLDPIDSSKGIKLGAHEGETNEYTNPTTSDDDDSDSSIPSPTSSSDGGNKEKSEEEKTRERLYTFYFQILIFALLSNDRLKTMTDIVNVIDANDNNRRIARHIGLKKSDIETLRQAISNSVLNEFDYKIHDMSDLLKDESIQPVERVKNAMRRFGRMSVSEIITPSNRAKEIVDILPEDCFSQNKKILDIASKQGEFTCALYERYCELGNEDGKKNIYAIPTSTSGEEFTRKVFSLLGIPSKNIIKDYNTFDLIDSSKNEKYIKALKDMKFDAIVGNPPYQEKGKLGGNGDAPIYQDFASISRKIESKYIVFIIPSKWFTSGSKRLLGPFRKEMLQGKRISKMVAYANSYDVFPKPVEIKGGVCYFLENNSYQGNCDYTFINGGEIITDNLNLGALDIFIRIPRVSKIVQKVHSKGEESLSQIISSDTPFGFPSNVKKSKKRPFDVSEKKDREFNTAIYLIETERKIEYVRRKDVKKNIQDIGKWKVLLTEAGGSGNDKIVLGDPVIARPNSVCTQSYLYIPVNNRNEACNLIKYIKTRFVRFLVSSIKITQHAQANVYEFVPLQDFTKDSDIDWSKSIDEIDNQLYAKYGIEDEIDFIRSIIKPM